MLGWGEEFEKLYTQYEREVSLVYICWLCFACFEYAFCLLLPCFSKKIHVHMGKSKEGCSGTESLWFEILKSQIETGTPCSTAEPAPHVNVKYQIDEHLA